jgi:hypothetical protein
MLEALYDRIDTLSVGNSKGVNRDVVFEQMYTAKNYCNRCEELRQKMQETQAMVRGRDLSAPVVPHLTKCAVFQSSPSRK